MESRQYTAEELKQLHEEQVQAAVPLVLRIWEEMHAEKGGKKIDDDRDAEVRRVG